MDIASWMVIAAIAILAWSFIIRPLVEKSSLAVTAAEKESSALLAERDQVLIVLQELDLDFAMGKVSQDDYQIQRAELVRRGASILKLLDTLGVSMRRSTAREEAADELDEEIEAEILRRRGSTAVGFCGQCGSKLQPGDRFCSNCGAPVGQSESEQ